MEKIASRENPKIKDAARLLTKKSERAKRGLFVCEGARLCADAAESGVNIRTAFFTEDFLLKHSETAKKIKSAASVCYEISESAALKLSDAKTPQGVTAVCEIPCVKAPESGKFIIIDSVADPSNIGAIARSAEAFGIDKMIIGPGSADVFSPKSVRASMGALFRLPLKFCVSLTDEINDLKKNGFSIYGSVVKDFREYVQDCDFSEKCALVIGSEAFGMSGEVKSLCDSLITIPMQGRAESLNASTAAAVLIWEMTK